jgi:hypothetical protein
MTRSSRSAPGRCSIWQSRAPMQVADAKPSRATCSRCAPPISPTLPPPSGLWHRRLPVPSVSVMPSSSGCCPDSSRSTTKSCGLCTKTCARSAHACGVRSLWQRVVDLHCRQTAENLITCGTVLAQIRWDFLQPSDFLPPRQGSRHAKSWPDSVVTKPCRRCRKCGVPSDSSAIAIVRHGRVLDSKARTGVWRPEVRCRDWLRSSDGIGDPQQANHEELFQ